MTVYKLVDTDTGLFSTGSTFPRWEEKGKIWMEKGHVVSHLMSILRWNCEAQANPRKVIPASWGIVEFELERSGQTSAIDFLKGNSKKYAHI